MLHTKRKTKTVMYGQVVFVLEAHLTPVIPAGVLHTSEI